MRWTCWLVLAVGCSGGSAKDDDTGGDGPLTEEDFAELFAEVGCDAQVSCNADPSFIDAFCDPDDVTQSTDPDCTFDADYAADCLDGEWTCSTVAGVTIAEPPSVCLLVTECADTTGDDDDDGSDTGTGDDDDDDGAPMLFDDGALESGVDCVGTSVDFIFDFLGEASGGWIDFADTSNADGPYGNWNETHSLLASGITEDGWLTVLDAPGIQTGASLSSWQDGVETVFRCDYHFSVPGTMTYAARAYDFTGVLADCVAWGHDPAGFIDGFSPSGVDYVDDNLRPAEQEFAGCRVSTAAR